MTVSGYCNNCRQYLCEDCHVTHNRLPVTRGHAILTRDDMPHQENANKRLKRLDFCRKHPHLVKDMLCSTHNTMECTLCCSREHQNCVVNSVHQISSAHVQEFYDLIRSFKDDLELVRSAMNENIDEIEERRRKLLIEAKSDYDKIIKNANNFFEETKREIREMSDKLLNNRLQNKSELENLILKLDKELVTINTYTGKPINEIEMLRMQDFVKSITKYAGDFREKYLFVRFLKPDLDLNKQTSKFMNTSHTSFGRVSERESRVKKPIIAVPDITFPVIGDNTSSESIIRLRKSATRTLFSASQTPSSFTAYSSIESLPSASTSIQELTVAEILRKKEHAMFTTLCRR